MSPAASPPVNSALTDRQFPRFTLQLVVTIGDATVRAQDWSAVDIRLAWPHQPLPGIGIIHAVTLTVSLAQSRIAMDCRVEVVEVADAGRLVCCRFTELSAERAALFHTLSSAWLNGEVGEFDGIIQSAAAPEPSAGNRARPLQRRRRFGTAAVVALVLACLVAVGQRVYADRFVVDGDGHLTSADAIWVRSPRSGMLLDHLVPAGSTVSPGTVLAVVRSNTGNTVLLKSACACRVGTYAIGRGGFVDRNERVVALQPPNAPVTATVTLPLPEDARLRVGSRALVDLHDGTPAASGHVTQVVRRFSRPGEIRSTDPQAGTIPLAEVTIRFDETHRSGMLGQPVTARIDTLRTADLTDVGPAGTAPDTAEPDLRTAAGLR